MRKSYYRQGTQEPSLPGGPQLNHPSERQKGCRAFIHWLLCPTDGGLLLEALSVPTSKPGQVAILGFGESLEAHSKETPEGVLGADWEHGAVHPCTEIRWTEAMAAHTKPCSTQKRLRLTGLSPHFCSMLINNLGPKRQAHHIQEQHRVGGWEQIQWVPSSERSQEVGMADRI